MFFLESGLGVRGFFFGCWVLIIGVLGFRNRELGVRVWELGFGSKELGLRFGVLGSRLAYPATAKSSVFFG